MQPPEGSEPDGPGEGKRWVPRPGVTFLAAGCMTRSLVAIEPPPAKGMVGVDVQGKWNHGAEDTLSLIFNPDTAREFAADLLEAANAADHDLIRYNRGER